MQSASDFNGKASHERSNGYMLTHKTHAQLFGLMAAESYDAGCVELEILRFTPELTVGASEEELVSDQSVESRRVGGQLRRTNVRFALDDVHDSRRGLANQHVTH